MTHIEALSPTANDLALQSDKEAFSASKEVIERCQARARDMLARCKKVNPKQYAMITDMSPHVAGICPRRAGKSFAGALAALITGEMKPGAISLIISLNKQQLRRIYWSGGPSGLYTLAKMFNIKLEFNNTYLRWEHENGSIGYLLGCEDDEQLEVIRGLEADLYLIDECKSFQPAKLNKLIDQIIDPQRMTRKGRLMLIGTPGFIPMGPFYEATCAAAKDQQGRRFSLPFGQVDPWGRTPEEDLLWSLHSWTLEDNTAKPHQWIEALKKKRSKGWADDHPAWLREYLGQWTFVGDGLVFAYAGEKIAGRCTWTPVPTEENPTGLPLDGKWRFVGGLDFGYEAPTAFVVAGYSRKYGQIRHVFDFSTRHLLTHEIADRVRQVERKLKIQLEMIYADVGNLGKAMAEELVRDFALPIERAQKREKLDYIEQLNGAFHQGEVLIIPGTTLETQLLTNAWDIEESDEENLPMYSDGTRMSSKENMGRLGLLVEDESIPNDSTDALLYLFRGCLHRFGKTETEAALEKGSPAYFAAKEAKELAEFRKELAKQEASPNGIAFGNELPDIPAGLMPALARKNDAWTRLTRIISKPSSTSSQGRTNR